MGGRLEGDRYPADLTSDTMIMIHTSTDIYLNKRQATCLCFLSTVSLVGTLRGLCLDSLDCIYVCIYNTL